MTRALNVGAGHQQVGDVRVDATLSPSVHAIADAEHLPFRDGVFSTVYMNCVFEHLRNPGAALDEMYRVLEAGGNIDLTTDHAAYWAFHLLMDHSTHYTTGRDLHYALFTPGHVRAHCEAAGFRVISMTLEYNPNGRLRTMDCLVRLIPFLGIFTAWRIRVMAVKGPTEGDVEPVVAGRRALALSNKFRMLYENRWEKEESQ